MIIICGLGNPGLRYEQTRHNMGFWTLDALSRKLDIPVQKIKHTALEGEGRIGDKKVILAKPQTYMNISGESVRLLVDYYGVDPTALLVVYDDIDLAVGDVRIRRKGSGGTHNGMRSIVKHIGSQESPRIRIGIGAGGGIPLEKYVLMKVPPHERPELLSAVARAADACDTFVREGVDEAMRKWSGRASGPATHRDVRQNMSCS